MITKEAVFKKLKTVIDPELNVNIVDLGLIYNVAIDQKTGRVKITMTLTTPGCPLSMVFEELITEAVKKVANVKKVIINLVWEPAWEPERMTDSAEESLGLL